MNVNTEQHVAVAVDLGGTKMSVALVRSDGRIVSLRRCLTNSNEGAEAVVKRLLLGIGEMLSRARLTQSELVGIAVACAGVIDMGRGMVTESPNLPGFSRIRLRDMIAREFGVESYLINDASAAAWGEYKFGSGARCHVQNLVYLTVSTGIGGGMVLGGQLYLGSDGSAGEIGHMIIKADGPLCKCGRKGCLESLASGWAVARDAVEYLKKGEESSILQFAGGKIENVTAAVVSAAAKQGDTLAQRVIGNAASYLGVGLANIINVFNPELIIVGGGLAKMGRLLLEPACAVAKALAFGLPGKTVRIVRARLVANAGVVGAAAYIFSQAGRGTKE